MIFYKANLMQVLIGVEAFGIITHFGCGLQHKGSLKMAKGFHTFCLIFKKKRFALNLGGGF